MADYPTLPSNSGSKTAKRQRNSSTAFWLIVAGASVLSLGLMTWGASIAMAKRGGEKLLRADVLFRRIDAGIVRKDQHAEPKPKDVAPPKKTATPPPPLLPTMTEAPKPVALEFPPPIINSPEPPSLKIPVPAPPKLADPINHVMPKFDLTPPPIVETCDDPIIYLHPCTIHRGDSPMIRNWKMLTMVTALSATTVFIAPQPIIIAQEKKAEVPDELLKSLQEISRRLDALEKKKTPTVDTDAITDALRAEIRKLENGVLSELQGDIKGLKKSVEAIKSDVGSLQSEQLRHKLKIEQLVEEVASLKDRLKAGPAVGAVTPAVDKTMFEDLSKSLKAIHDAITKLGPTEKRIMMSPPNPNGSGNIATPVTPSVGRVVLTNLYTDELLFTVNGTPYRVAARTSKVIDVPTGTMNYEVFSTRWGFLERSVTSITAGDTFTLAANTR